MNKKIKELMDHIQGAGLRLTTNTPIVIRNDDNTFSIDCTGMFGDGHEADVAKLKAIKFKGPHSSPVKNSLFSKKGAVCMNLLGLSVPADQLEADISGQIIHQLVSNSKEIPTPTTTAEMVALRAKLLGKDDSYYEQFITESHPELIDIQKNTKFATLLASFDTKINDDHTISVTQLNPAANLQEFNLLLSSMRTQIRLSNSAFLEGIAHNFSNIEFALICKKMNAKTNAVVQKFASRTLKAAEAARASSSSDLDKDIREQHGANVSDAKKTVGRTVLDESNTRSETDGRKYDAEAKEKFISDCNDFYAKVEKKVGKHNKDIADWNFSRDELVEFLKSEKANEFFVLNPEKPFNGQELAVGLHSYLTEKFPTMPEAEMGAMFTRCYSLMTQEISPEKLLTHNPIKSNPELKKLIEAAANANAPAGPTA